MSSMAAKRRKEHKIYLFLKQCDFFAEIVAPRSRGQDERAPLDPLRLLVKSIDTYKGVGAGGLLIPARGPIPTRERIVGLEDHSAPPIVYRQSEIIGGTGKTDLEP